jgi:hypothetical protein
MIIDDEGSSTGRWRATDRVYMYTPIFRAKLEGVMRNGEADASFYPGIINNTWFFIY